MSLTLLTTACGDEQSTFSEEQAIAGDDRPQQNENTFEPRENERYEVVLNPGVLDIDANPEFRDIEVNVGLACGEETPVVSANALTLTPPCLEIEVTYSSLNGVELEEGLLIISTRNRFMGKIAHIRHPFRLRKSLFIVPVSIDDIFALIRIDGTFNADALVTNIDGDEPAIQTVNSRDNGAFTVEQSLATEFFSFTEERGDVVTETAFNGTIRIDALLGSTVPKDEQHLLIDSEIHVTTNSAISLSLSDNFRQEVYGVPTTLTLPLSFGLVFADLKVDLRNRLQARTTGDLIYDIQWATNDVIHTRSNWTFANGWTNDTTVDTTPWQLTPSIDNAGRVELEADLALESTVGFLKTTGIRVKHEPALIFTIDGNTTVSSFENADEVASASCLFLGGNSGLSVEVGDYETDAVLIYELTPTNEALINHGDCSL
jgi:hypothetical protein